MRSKAPFRLLYNNDTTNTAGVVSPWHEDGEPFREEMLVSSIDEVAGVGVDAYLLSPGMGWVPWWQSEVEPGFYEWWKRRTGLEVLGWGGRGYDKYVCEGGDMVQVLVDACGVRGMAPFVSLRLNDVHLQENYARKNPESLVSSRFYVQHPEWHIDRDHPEREGYYGGRGMDWAVPEVREHKLSLLRELAGKYDLAGLELDFLRHSRLFRDDGPEAAGRVRIITDFVAQVRDALGGAASGRHLCVRIPLELSAHAALGLDVRRLRNAGVDMFNLSCWYHTTQRSDVAKVRQLAPNAAIYLEMTHATASHRYFMKQTPYGTHGDPRTSDHQFYTTALLAHRRGADGLSLFNFVYYRMGHKTDTPVMEPPFHVLRKLNDTEFLSRQPQYYMLGGTTYFRQLPRELAPGQASSFELDMVPPSAPGRLRVHTERPLTAAHRIAVDFNGASLEACPDVSRFFGNPFDGMISPRRHRRAWLVPADLPRDGVNSVELKLLAGEAVNVIYIDVAVPCPQRRTSR